MNLEFHYYILYILCKEAGIEADDCITIAYSSQYVDNNIVEQQINLDGSIYKTIVTHNYGWWSDWFPKNVYIPFHFFPGNINHIGAKRKDGGVNPYNCTPGSSRVSLLLERAFRTNNLYRIGIGIHTYADSWAHQNFSGLNESWNTLSGDSIIPSVGHAEVISQPDAMTGRWLDQRLVAKNQYIENQQRFMEAARYIFMYLCQYSKKPAGNWQWISKRLKQLIGPYDENDKNRENRIFDYIVEEDLLKYNKYEWIRDAVYSDAYESLFEDSVKNYDKFNWIKDTLFYKTSVLERPVLNPKPDIKNSHFYKWHEAAKAHLAEARIILQDLL